MGLNFFFFIFKKKKKKIIWLHQVLIAAHGIFSCRMWILSCSMWALVPWPGIELGAPALEVWCLSHWTTREVPMSLNFNTVFLVSFMLSAQGLLPCFPEFSMQFLIGKTSDKMSFAHSYIALFGWCFQLKPHKVAKQIFSLWGIDRH